MQPLILQNQDTYLLTFGEDKAVFRSNGCLYLQNHYEDTREDRSRDYNLIAVSRSNLMRPSGVLGQ